MNVLDIYAYLGAYLFTSKARKTALTFTRLRFSPEHIPRRAGATVTSRGVSAQPVVTEQSVYQALVNIWRHPLEDRRHTY